MSPAPPRSPRVPRSPRPSRGLVRATRIFAAAAFASVVLVDTSGARAQEIPGVMSGLPDGASLGSSFEGATSFGSGAGTSGFGGTLSSSSASLSASPDALFGLERTDAPVVLTLEDALAEASAKSFDLRIAREKVLQQEAQVRKAWSFLLPHVSLGGTYTFNCTFGGRAGLADCGDQTIAFLSEEQLDQQALLYNSLGEIMSQVAAFEQDPERQEKLRDQARGLFAAADAVEKQKGEIEPIVVQPAHVFGGSLQVTMPLFNGRALPLLQNAYAAVDAVELASGQARSALLLAVTRAYYTAAAAKKMLAIAEQQRESATRHRDAIKSRVELEALPPLALRRAELDVIRAEQAIKNAQAGYRAAIAGVGQLTGIKTYFDVVEPPGAPLVDASAGAEELLERAYRGRPDLRAQKVALEVAERARLDAWMMFLPSVNLVGQARATSNVNGFIASPVQGALLITASLPLYDGGARYAALAESSSRIREELLKVRQIEERIHGQVLGNLEQLELREQALALAREAVAVAREASEQANALYEVGTATPLDVSDANLALFVAEAELARAELELQQAQLGLAYVVGAFPSSGPAPEPLRDEEAEAARARMAPLAPSSGGE